MPLNSLIKGMSRRSKQQPIAPLAADENYWQNFISHRFGNLEAVEKVIEKRSPSPSPPDEMEVFISRVAERLAPMPAATPLPGEMERILRIREEVKRELRDLMEGRIGLGDWFTRTRRNFNLRSYELGRIIYDALEGLRSREAREMRDQWLNYLSSEMRGYGVA
jgi:hypothetical protein